MAVLNRKYSKKIEVFERNITKRGHVPENRREKTKGHPVGPVALAVFVFVVIGSAIVQIINSAQRGMVL